jgi:alpha-amylase/alpha-mannosidase (GH57 family)
VFTDNIHGHFYQPPRENPWLEAIEIQDSAYPYKDWNQRITSECYAPNVASRILDENGDIADIVNNYSKISFNFGPTLLTWLQREEPDIYLAILKADKSSQHFYSGHGAAIAQAYNHMILPLANDRDKKTQVLWGIKDFEFRFKRKPEGMWLPETAVDVPSLEVLAEQGIQFTILAPYQAEGFRLIGTKEWTVLNGSPLPVRKPYLCPLPSGRKIFIFFYDGPISHDIAFSGLLNNGEVFAKRFLQAFSQDSQEVELVHVATDGETYGHHHRFGNMALSYGVHYIESVQTAKMTVLGEYLKKYPPEYEVRIKECSSWSCSHGVERWRSDCGCCIGGNSWKQLWRKPLREAMDWLRDELADVYQSAMSKFSDDPWAVRNAYIDVVLDRSDDSVKNFFETNFKRSFSDDEKIFILKAIEMQRHAMFMFTSCGWFFDEVSGIETVQIMQYAARAIQLAKEISSQDFEPEFMKRLEAAVSNIAEYKNAKEIYARLVKPQVISLLNVGAHFAISSLFQAYPDMMKVYCYHVEIKERKLHEIGKQKLLIGTATIRSDITHEKCVIDFAVLHFGDYNIHCGVRYHTEEQVYIDMHDDMVEVFLTNNIADAIQKMAYYFGQHIYDLWDLFKNEQGRVLEDVFENTLDAIESNFRGIYDHYYPLMQVRPDFRIPLPKALAMTVEFVLNRDLATELEKKEMDFNRIEHLVREMKRWSFTRDKEGINLVATQKLDYLMTRLTRYSRDTGLLHMLCEFLRVCAILPLDLNVWRAQNIYFSMTQRLYPRMQNQAKEGDMEARLWIMEFERLSGFLKVHSP